MTMGCLGSMARRMVCLLCVGFFVVLVLLQGVTNVEKQGATKVASLSSNSSLPPPPPPLPLQTNLQVPKLKGRTMGPKEFDTFRDIKRKVPNGPDPIHNRYDNFYMFFYVFCNTICLNIFYPSWVIDNCLMKKICMFCVALYNLQLNID